MQDDFIRWSDLGALIAAIFDTAEAWVTATYYSAGTLVVNDWDGGDSNGFFICTEAHTSASETEPGVGGSYSTVWKYISGGGGVGATGAAGPAGSAGPAQVCQGRLTLSSGVPVPVSDITSAGTLYLTPYHGHYIGLYYDGAWTTYEFDETSIALSGLSGYTNYDVYAFYNAVSELVELELAAWKKVQASNSPTSGASKTISLADTSGLAVGQNVTVYDGSHTEIAVITTVTTDTSIVVASLTYGYTTPYVVFPKTRQTEIEWSDGVLVKSGDATRRYLGTIRTDSGGLGQDAIAGRFIFNAQNRSKRPIYVAAPLASWSYAIAAWRAVNADSTARTKLVAGMDDVLVHLEAMIPCLGVASHYYFTGIGVDATDDNDAQIYLTGNATVTVNTAILDGYVGEGYVFLQMVEKCSDATSHTVYGSGTSSSCGMVGWAEM